MNAKHISFLLDAHPWDNAHETPKIRKFYEQSGHIKLERADETKNEKWLEEMKKRGYLPAMKTHREGCRGVFDFDFFDKWVEQKMMEAGIAPDFEFPPNTGKKMGNLITEPNDANREKYKNLPADTKFCITSGDMRVPTKEGDRRSFALKLD